MCEQFDIFDFKGIGNKYPKQEDKLFMTTATLLTKNFGLSEEEFDQLKTQMIRGDESLFQVIFFAHFESCMNYLKHQYQVSHGKAYDVTMDALLLFRRKILEGKIRYGNLRFLFTQMASHIYLKEVQRAPSKALQKEVQVILSEVAPKLDKDELQQLNQAWAKLGDKCKLLLKRVYYQNEQLKDIAEELQQAAPTLRKQKQRCVDKLRQFFKNKR